MATVFSWEGCYIIFQNLSLFDIDQKMVPFASFETVRHSSPCDSATIFPVDSSILALMFHGVLLQTMLYAGTKRPMTLTCAQTAPPTLRQPHPDITLKVCHIDFLDGSKYFTLSLDASTYIKGCPAIIDATFVTHASTHHHTSFVVQTNTRL